jgi:hypothetical protein
VEDDAIYLNYYPDDDDDDEGDEADWIQISWVLGSKGCNTSGYTLSPCAVPGQGS